MTKTSKSYFGKYFRYKLGENKHLIIIFALFNLLTAIVLPHFLLLTNNNYYSYENPDNRYEILAVQSFDYAIKPMVFAAIVGAIMITVTTVKLMNIYHDRAALDTLGCLPLTYRERFLGDILSAVFVNFVSFIPSFIISAIIERVFNDIIKENVKKYEPGYSVTVISHSVTYFLLVILLSYIGVYAVSAFIKSCCGRFGTAVIFSFVTMAVIPGIYTVYANYFNSYSVGVDLGNEICSKVGLLPPFGFIFSLVLRQFNAFISYEEASSVDYLIDRPACVIVPLLISAAFLFGAYFIGKRRRAERTGEGFVFNSVFHVLVMLLLTMTIGVGSTYFFGDKGAGGVFIMLFITFFFFAALEITQNKGFKGFWKTVVRFAAVFGTCFLFLFAVKTTNAFEYYKILPNANSIEEVHISGYYFFTVRPDNNTSSYIYKDPEAVSTILSEHKKLLETDELKTGEKLRIVYVTKGGKEISRGYYCGVNDSDPIKNFSDAIKELPIYDASALGVIASSDFSGLTATYSSKSDNKQSGVIRSDKTEELAEILRRDIERYYFQDSLNNHSLGTVTFIYNQSGNFDTRGIYTILDVYEDTLKFLNDPANFVNSEIEETVKSYHVYYDAGDEEGTLSDIKVTVSTEDTSEYAKALLSIIEKASNSNNDPPCFTIYDEMGNREYRIKPGKEQVALKAMLGLFRENSTG